MTNGGFCVGCVGECLSGRSLSGEYLSGESLSGSCLSGEIEVTNTPDEKEKAKDEEEEMRNKKAARDERNRQEREAEVEETLLLLRLPLKRGRDAARWREGGVEEDEVDDFLVKGEVRDAEEDGKENDDEKDDGTGNGRILLRRGCHECRWKNDKQNCVISFEFLNVE